MIASELCDCNEYFLNGTDPFLFDFALNCDFCIRLA